MKFRWVDQLAQSGKVRLVRGASDQETNTDQDVIGLLFDHDKRPTLEELMQLARELEQSGSKAETPLRYLLGDTVAAMEALPGIKKRDLVNTAFDVFGERAYDRLRRYMHVAQAYPVGATFSDGRVRRRTDVGWSILQELAPAWVPDDFRQQMLNSAAQGKVTIGTLRQRLEPFRPSKPRDESFSQVQRNASPESPPVLQHVRDPWEEAYARLVTVPEPIPAYTIAADARRILAAIDRRALCEQAVNLLLVGETGYGKTSLARQFAAETGRPVFVFNCGSVQQHSEWWGTRDAAEGRTFFRPSALVYALRRGGVVVVLDEINRIPAHLLNPLLPLLDDRRETVTPIGQHVRIAEGTILIGTANLGEGYFGTFQMDRALFNRLQGGILTLPPPPPEAMRKALAARTGCAAWQAELLVKIAGKVNAANVPVKIGMRSLLEAGRWLGAGLSLRQACEAAIINGCTLEDSSCRGALENILDGLIEKDTKVVTELVTVLKNASTR